MPKSTLFKQIDQTKRFDSIALFAQPEPGLPAETGDILVVVDDYITVIPYNNATPGHVLTAGATPQSGASWQPPSGGGGGGGLTVSGPNAGIDVALVGSNYVVTAKDDLAGLEAITGTGIVARTSASPETYATRTITGGTGVSVTNGDGVAGNPTISVPGAPFAPQTVTVRYDDNGGTFQTWSRPSGHTMMHVSVVGGASGGGPGQSGAEGTARRGGGGGAIGGDSEWSGPIPCDTLHVLVGTGGAGGTGTSVGGTGERSIVTTDTNPVNQQAYLLVESSLTGSGGGGPGSATGAAGSAGNVFSGAARYATKGTWSTRAGIAGSAGGNAVAGVTASAQVAYDRAPGAGGAGRAATNLALAGGQVSGQGNQVTVVGGAGSAAGAGSNGGNGAETGNRPGTTPPSTAWTSMGGAGAGNGITGGKGGDGALGSGGGGGGAGVTGGAGGNGGAGFVVITSW
jgi:hypothetical protein